MKEPPVVLDPYDESPLAVLILFQTEMTARVEITIPGVDEDTGVIHTFEELSTRHVVPMYGLYHHYANVASSGWPDAENQVKIEMEPLLDWLDDYIILTESYRGDYAQGLRNL